MKHLKKNSDTEAELVERFIGYAKVSSASSSKNADNGIIPSTERQRDFANKVAGELKSLGFSGVQVTEYSYVYAFIPPTQGMEKISFCLLAHLDTVEDVSGENVNPQIVRDYDGATLPLKNGFVLDPARIKELAAAAKNRETIITTDGTTLLGGDDKAGMAIIVTAMNYLLKHPQIKHGKIELIFSPDEETGHGMDKVPLELISSKYAYTLDGSDIGELEAECFNAYKSRIVFKGRASHTGTARANKMVNALSIASNFVNSLPKIQSPQATDYMEGFFAPLEFSGNMEEATVSILLRDFATDCLEIKKRIVEQLAFSAALSEYGSSLSFGDSLDNERIKATYTVEHIKQYLNMKDKIAKMPFVKDQLVQAYRASGIEPVFQAIRGGTDGSRLTEMGIPCPNIFTGAHNFHSQLEWVSADQMLAAADIIINLAEIATM